MASIILDAELERKLIQDRQARGADRFDEVWDGTYIMSPLADNEHQRLVARLTTALDHVIEESSLGSVYPGCNVTDPWQLELYRLESGSLRMVATNKPGGFTANRQ